MSDRIKWQYHFLQKCFGSGTHYVLLDIFAEDLDASAFGPLGIICANGQGMTFDRLKGRIQTARTEGRARKHLAHKGKRGVLH